MIVISSGYSSYIALVNDLQRVFSRNTGGGVGKEWITPVFGLLLPANFYINILQIFFMILLPLAYKLTDIRISLCLFHESPVLFCFLFTRAKYSTLMTFCFGGLLKKLILRNCSVANKVTAD